MSERRGDRAQARAERVTGILWFAAIAAAVVVAGAVLALVSPPLQPRPPAAAEGGGGGVGNPAVGRNPGNVGRGTPLAPSAGNELAIFAQGCFWGVEERFRKVPGVVATAVGYTGGHTSSPTYADVSGHGTGHAEAVLVEFDPARVRYEDLLRLFWATHDPTSGDRQGPDHGSQYRSAIFTFGEAQARAAAASRAEEQARLADPITTEIAPAKPFWLAEAEHQQFDEKHGALSCPLPQRARRK